MPPAAKAGGIFGAWLTRDDGRDYAKLAHNPRAHPRADRRRAGGSREDETKRKYRREPGFPVPILIAPATLWLVVFLFLPLLSIFIFSFWKDDRPRHGAGLHASSIIGRFSSPRVFSIPKSRIS
jgi:hypothetical protein